MAFPTLRQAQEVALQMSDVGGITLDRAWNYQFKYLLYFQNLFNFVSHEHHSGFWNLNLVGFKTNYY